MILETLTYDLDAKTWSKPVMPPLDSDRTLVLAFGSRDLLDDPAPLLALRRAYPKAKLLGCSSAGEIAGAEVRDRSLSVSVTRFDKTTLVATSVDVKNASESFAAGEKLARALQRPDLRGVLVLSEGLGVNGSQLVAGLNAVLPSSVVVTGGLSGDGTRFERTWVCFGDSVRSGTVAAVGFYGDHISIRHGSKGGWDKFGPERVITRSEGNVLFSLDGKPALALYKEYLGDKAAELPASGLLFPLAMRATVKDDKFLVRTLLAVDHEKQSMTFAGDLPKGHLVQLMKADFDRLIGGAELATKTATGSGPTPPGASLAVAISCVGRRIVLGDRIEEEVEAVRDALPKEALVTGFYSYGEISPYAIGHSDLHNQTMTLTLFAESQTPIAQRASAVNGALALSVDSPHAVNVDSPRALEPGRREPPSLAIVERTRAAALDLTPTPSVVQAPVTERSSSPPRASVREVAPAGSSGQAAGITFDVRKEGAILVVRLAGRMTETFKGAALAKQLEGDVLLDLGDVERVTSFGVREWLQLLQEAEPRVRKLYLGRCAEPIVNQMSMIRRFSGDGQIVSFYAPYACEACSTQFERLVDCEYDADAITKGVAPAASCPRCDGAGAFDDDARTYFGFATPHAGKPVPREVRVAVAALERRDEPVGGEAVEKTVEGRVTRVKVNCKLDANVRWNRVLDGLEGQVVFDLGAAPSTTPDGAAAFEAALRALVGETETMRIEGCPRLVAERFVTPPRVAPATIVSAILEGRCGPCGALRPVVITLDESATQILEGQDPHALCKRCNAPLSFEATRPLLKLLGAHALADVGAAAPKSSAPAAPPKATASPGSAPPPSLATAPVVDPTPALPAPPVAIRSGGGTSSGLYAVVAILGLAVLGLGALVLRGQTPAKAAAVTEIPAPVASIAASAAAPASTERAAAGPAWSKTSDLPPPWVERTFVIDGESVFVVGRGGPAANEEAALGMARSDALERLAANMLTELAGSPVHDFVAARVTVDPHGERQKEAIEPVARRYLRQVGPIATPERVEAISRQREQGVESFVRYKLSKPSYLAAVESYRQTATFQGLTIARFFPELEGSIRTEGELIIVAVQPGFQGALVGVRPGDVVVSVNGHPVSTVEAFNRVANDEWTAALPGSAVSIDLESLGARRSTRIVKPSRGPAP